MSSPILFIILQFTEIEKGFRITLKYKSKKGNKNNQNKNDHYFLIKNPSENVTGIVEKP